MRFNGILAGGKKMVGLVGSGMYVREQTLNLDASEGSAGQVGGYEISYEGGRDYSDSSDNLVKEVTLKVVDAASGRELGLVSEPQFTYLSFLPSNFFFFTSLNP